MTTNNDPSLIQVEIVQGDIEHRLPLGEFRDRLVQEIGSVTFTMTRKQFRRQVSAAVDRVIQGVRDAAATTR